MARLGRDLEKLVATLENLLSDTQVDIKSPDYIMGVNSGSFREIDVSLRAQVGSSHVLVILEVRDRRETEDVTWIEQLATKRADVLASKVVAISSSGFSEGARNMAAHLGIELRSVEELTVDAIVDWFRVPYLESMTRHGQFLHAELRAEKEFHDALKAALEKVDGNSPILVHTETRNTISITEAWQEILNQNPQLFDDLEPNGETRRLKLQANYVNPKSRYQVLTSSGPVHIKQIIFDTELSIKVTHEPISQITQYSDADGKRIAQSIRFTTKVGDKDADLGFHKIEGKSETFITLQMDSTSAG